MTPRKRLTCAVNLKSQISNLKLMWWIAIGFEPISF